MATTDSNGILRYQDTDGAPTPPVVNTWLQSVSDALTRSTPQVVANIMDRNSLVASSNPTPSNPLVVWRIDAPASQHYEVTENGNVWETIPSTASAAVPMIGPWSESSLIATRVGPLLMITGTVARMGGTVPAGASTDIGVVSVGWRPSNLAHATLSGQILGAALPYTARGSLVVTPAGNVSVYTEALTTTLQVSLVCVQ